MGAGIIILLALRTMLANENHRRNKETCTDEYDNVFITHVNSDGTISEKKVDRVCCCHLIRLHLALILQPDPGFP